MPSFLKSLGLIANLVMAPMAISVPTLNTNTTTALNISIVSHGAAETRWSVWKEMEYWDKWAQFCDDPNCSQNCGISVSMNNPGCLEQPPGRKSIKIHGMRRGLEGISLTISPRKGCHCQAVCSPVELKGRRVSPEVAPLVDNGDYTMHQTIDYCWTISEFEWYNMHTEWSFRFHQKRIDPECGANQCRWDNSALPEDPDIDIGQS